jgi:hypothetical protein
MHVLRTQDELARLLNRYLQSLQLRAVKVNDHIVGAGQLHHDFLK